MFFRRVLPIVCFALIFLFFDAKNASAQPPQGVTTSVTVEGDTLLNGSIICETETSFALCDTEYSPKIYGVLVLQPEVGFISSTSASLKPVAVNGIADVRVSTSNGPIAVGDYITTSNNDGIGQKALKSGYVIGVAQQEYNTENPLTIGTIRVSLQLKPAIMTNKAGANLIELIRDGIDASYLSPVFALRYLLASLITISSIVLGFWFFARVAHSGVQAIGRNPLAGKTIQMGILLNVLIALGVMGTGLGIAYLLLVL